MEELDECTEMSDSWDDCPFCDEGGCRSPKGQVKACKQDAWAANASMEEIDNYYKDKEKKNIALVDCCAKAIWYSFWIAIGIGMWRLMYKGVYCWLYH
jgi:hypothetical protein